jgi:ABC-type multidrug transport system fused ATPase/permease subunit
MTDELDFVSLVLSRLCCRYLSFWIDNLFQLGSSLVVFTVSVMVLVPPVSALILAVAPVFALVVEAVDRSNREMKRMSNSAMGPVLSNVQEALHGRVLARAMSLESYFIERHHRLVDTFNRATFVMPHRANPSLLNAICVTFVLTNAVPTLLS